MSAERASELIEEFKRLGLEAAIAVTRGNPDDAHVSIARREEILKQLKAAHIQITFDPSEDPGQILLRAQMAQTQDDIKALTKGRKVQRTARNAYVDVLTSTVQSNWKI